jgi:hypothetical protein
MTPDVRRAALDLKHVNFIGLWRRYGSTVRCRKWQESAVAAGAARECKGFSR